MIAIDGRFVTDELSGIGRYTLGLVSGLAEANPPQRITILGGHEPMIRSAMCGCDTMDFVPAAERPLSLRGQCALPGILRRLRARVFHSPYLSAPLLARRIPSIITVHDLIPERHPEGLPRAWKVKAAPLWRAWCRAQYRRAIAIITVSDFSRRELIEHAKLTPDKVTRIYNGVHPAPAGDGVLFRRRFGIKDTVRIISYVGRHDPYKNIASLVRAFERVHESCSDAMLVIGGGLDPRYPEAREMAERGPARDAILFTGYLDEPMRISLLRASAVFAFPSRYEGFGLPPLEAMAAGVPVVAGNAASLPEVLGDAVTLVDPDDIEGLAGAILDLLRDASLRARRIEAGLNQAAKFTWQRCAEEHFALYEQVMQN